MSFLHNGSVVFVLKDALTKKVTRTTIWAFRNSSEESYYVRGFSRAVRRRDLATTVEEARRSVVLRIERQIRHHEGKLDWHNAAITRLRRRLVAWSLPEDELPIRNEEKLP